MPNLSAHHDNPNAADAGNHPGTHGDDTGDSNQLTSNGIPNPDLPAPRASR